MARRAGHPPASTPGPSARAVGPMFLGSPATAPSCCSLTRGVIKAAERARANSRPREFPTGLLRHRRCRSQLLHTAATPFGNPCLLGYHHLEGRREMTHEEEAPSVAWCLAIVLIVGVPFFLLGI